MALKSSAWIWPVTLARSSEASTSKCASPWERTNAPEVADPRLVDVVELAEVVEQLRVVLVWVLRGAPDAERAAGLVVVPGDHAAAPDGAERVAGRQHAGGLGRAALGVDERDGARAVEVLLDQRPVLLVGALGRAHPRLDRAAAPAAHPPRQPQVAGPGSAASARRSRKSVAVMKRRGSAARPAARRWRRRTATAGRRRDAGAGGGPLGGPAAAPGGGPAGGPAAGVT